ncbi:trypsin-1-like [Lasioglossum baleicum]|uniref:trypsin-1-like n=1 Tax=Lasioglossum baleicum TaxID=434251 RepID=UPI003FCD00BF
MWIRSLVCILVLVAVTRNINCEEDAQAAVIEKPEVTLNNATTADDKNFWEWLYGVIGVPVPATTTTTTRRPPPANTNKKCPPCKCGLTNTQRRIVGGTETQVNQYPWMALMMFRGRFYCGGSIINSRYVLTAAHCVDRFDPKLMSVRILVHNRNTTEADARTFMVDSVMKHSGYSTYNYNNDIALVRLTESIEFEGKMRPACLPEKEKTFAGVKAIVTGWGAIEESGPISQTLQEVHVPILTNTECRNTKYPSRRITDNMLCAGYKEGAKDSCQGDSGGPLHIANDNIYHIVGVVSWGEGCARPGYPGVYSRVNRYLTWISRNTMDACYC